MLFAEGFLGISNDAMVALAGAGSIIAVLFRLLISSKDQILAATVAEKERVIAELLSERTNIREFAREALQSAMDQANFSRKKGGKAPLVAGVGVIPKSNSPSTQKQRDEAEFETLRETLAMIKRETGQEPRPEPEHAAEPPLPLH